MGLHLNYESAAFAFMPRADQSGNFVLTFVHSRPSCRFIFFSKRAFNALSSASRCSGDNVCDVHLAVCFVVLMKGLVHASP